MPLVTSNSDRCLPASFAQSRIQDEVHFSILDVKTAQEVGLVREPGALPNFMHHGIEMAGQKMQASNDPNCSLQVACTLS